MKTKDNSLLPTLLLVLFIGLKLTGFIQWSWWWVFSPLWIPFIISIFVFGYYFIVGKLGNNDIQITMSDKEVDK